MTPIDKRRGERHDARSERRDEGPIVIFGIHAVDAALRNERRQVHRVLLTENAAHRLQPALIARRIQSERILPRALDRRLGADTVHQGALLEAEPLPQPTLVEVGSGREHAGPLLVLDQVTDPHNVGAILRSAAVFGAAGLIMTERHSPPLAGVLAKSASGALEHVAVVLVQNLARALAELGQHGYRRVGLDGDAEAVLEDAPLCGRIALVLGAEGRGLRQLTRERCDQLCRIATSGPITSLNVSNAAAVALHLLALRRPRT